MRARFYGRLSGLYGVQGDEQVFSALPRDKQESLALLSTRLVQLELWQDVLRIVNVYGQGGVGMYFSAVPDLESELLARSDFTRKFARHRDNSGGFIEKGPRRASLHFLYIDTGSGEREWHVHLDLYGPMGSPLSSALHLYYERWLRFRPDWRIMKPFVSE